MLVLTTKLDESVVLEVNGVKIEVKVCRVTGQQVRLGFTAPQVVRIVRKTVLERTENE